MELSRTLHDLWTSCQQNILKAQEQQARHYNKGKLPSPFHMGSRVMLKTSNIRTLRPSKKLDSKLLGPFTITAVIGRNSYRLNLPPLFGIHPVFYASLLEPYRPSTIPGRSVSPPPPVRIQGEIEYEVDKILDSRKVRNKVKYLVSWKGYSPGENTWEPPGNLRNSQELVSAFHLSNPTKPKP